LSFPFILWISEKTMLGVVRPAEAFFFMDATPKQRPPEKTDQTCKAASADSKNKRRDCRGKNLLANHFL